MLRILAVLVALLAGLTILAPSARVADAHPGGTDANGCHVCRTNCTERWGIPYGYYHRHYPVRPCFASVAPVPAAPPPSPYAAKPISAAQACSATFPGRAVVTFTWSRGLLSGDSQRLDLSLFDNGFAGGTFIGAGPLWGSAQTFTWDGLLPGAVHYYRVNTKSALGGWHPSGTYSFRTWAC